MWPAGNEGHVEERLHIQKRLGNTGMNMWYMSREMRRGQRWEESREKEGHTVM